MLPARRADRKETGTENRHIQQIIEFLESFKKDNKKNGKEKKGKRKRNEKHQHLSLSGENETSKLPLAIR